MPLARVGSLLLFYAHVPKTGGSSVEAYLQAKGRLALLDEGLSDWNRSTPQHLHRAVYQRLVPREFYDHGFATLRDPLARLISEYRYRSKTYKPFKQSLHRLIAPAGVKRAEATRITVGRGKIVADFDRWVPRIFRAYAKDPYLLDNHIRPQVEFVAPSPRRTGCSCSKTGLGRFTAGSIRSPAPIPFRHPRMKMPAAICR
ncbi:sulfotransferase family 2 domain-containing protein [Actibacterium sp. D379-3]